MTSTLGRASGGAAAAAGLHLALDWALRQPPVLVEHWAAQLCRDPAVGVRNGEEA